MTQRQKEAVVMLKEAIKKFKGCESAYLAMEDAISLKELIEYQVEYIKLLKKDYEKTEDKLIELQRAYQEQQDRINQLELEDNIRIEQILDKVRYLCGMKDRDSNQVYVITKNELNTLERRLKGEE